MESKAFEILVTGNVQEVNFRSWAQTTASRYQLAGWVRNNPDGSVSVYAEGDEANLNQFVEALRTGPENARVDRVTVDEVEPQGYSSFTVEY